VSDLRTPREWGEITGMVVMDPDGWRGSVTWGDTTYGPRDFDEPITRQEFDARAMWSTVNPVALQARPRTTRPEERRLRRGSERLPDEVIVDERRRVIRDRIDLVGNDLTATLRWCATHNEPVWEFRHGSPTCRYDEVTQVTHDHEIVDGPWELPEAGERSLRDGTALSVLTNAIGWAMYGVHDVERIELHADELEEVQRIAGRAHDHMVRWVDGEDPA
jgi:hypothetical protein